MPGVFKYCRSSRLKTVNHNRRGARASAVIRRAPFASARLIVGDQVDEDIFEAHARTLDAAGLAKFRLNACGYSLGTTYAPCWMDGYMAYKDNPTVVQPGMVFFLHMIIFDDETGLAATPGRTSLVTSSGSEVLSKTSLEFIVK